MHQIPNSSPTQPHRLTLGKALCSSVGGISLLNKQQLLLHTPAVLGHFHQQTEGKFNATAGQIDTQPCYQKQILPPLVYCELARAEESLLLYDILVLFIFRMLGISVKKIGIAEVGICSVLMHCCPQAGQQLPVIAVNSELHLWNMHLWYFYTLGHRMAENQLYIPPSSLAFITVLAMW